MSKNNIESNLVLKSAIEQIPVRIRRAGKRQIDLANEVGTSEGHLSQILNFHINSPRIKMMNNIERVLKSWGV
jgi:transcriptional regulator with XRE-family HTH domain